MNTTTSTPPSSKKTNFKCIFALRDHLGLVKKLEASGVKVHKDSHKIFGCVCFENPVDYKAFKAQLS